MAGDLNSISVLMSLTLGAVDRKIEEIAELLGPNQNKLLQVAEKIADGLTEDTHYNINLATRQAMVLA